jgi:UDP-N-acetylglucosamine 4,6-dehydratase/5-epimerase
MKLINIASTIAPNANHKIIGIRPGEKLHEQMIGIEDAPNTYEYEDYFKILPTIHNWTNDKKRIGNGVKVPQLFSYTSDNNDDWMSNEELASWINSNMQKFGKS